MTLKNLAIATAAALSFAAVPTASANNTLDPLVDLIPKGCETNDKQAAAWSWGDEEANGEGKGPQTQFGGGAVYSVEYTLGDNGVYPSIQVEVELVRFDPGLAMMTKMVYRCPKDDEGHMHYEDAVAGSCIAEIENVLGAIQEATEAKVYQMMGWDEESEVSEVEIVGNPQFEGVFVKAMNPGVAKGPGGRQNYEKTNVCDVPEEVEVPVEPEV